MPTDPLRPLHFLLLVFGGLINREQAKVVDYLREENRVLREPLDKRRERLSDEQRARLAARTALGRSLLESIATNVGRHGCRRIQAVSNWPALSAIGKYELRAGDAA